MGPLRQSPKRAHRSTAARAPDSRIREGGPPGSRAGRHARGELGVGMGALHLSFQGCHQPWGQAELAAGCGRYAVLNSAAEYSFFKRNRPVQVLKGSPLLSIIFQTLGTPFERQKKAPPMIRWCPESSGYTVETWVTRLTCKTIFRCCCSSFQLLRKMNLAFYTCHVQQLPVPLPRGGGPCFCL